MKGDDDRVFRELYLESEPEYYSPRTFFTRRRAEQKHNLRVLRETVHRLKPDAIFVWGMWNTSQRLPARAEAFGTPPTVYYISDHWPVTVSPHELYWTLPARQWYMKPVKQLLALVVRAVLTLEGGPPPLQFRHAMCVSKALRESLVSQGMPVAHAQIVYNGIDVRTFNAGRSGPDLQRKDGPIQMLVAGRLTYDKGIHSALEAVSGLVRAGEEQIRLAVVGEGRRDYVAYLHELVRRERIEPYVEFQPRVEREHMPALLKAFDILIFPSIAMEALPRMPQEAMAAGMLVIGTDIGGTQELLVEGETGLTFPPGDSAALADQIQRAITDPSWAASIATRGRQRVLEQFSLERMVDEIENCLFQVTAAAPSG